MDRTPPSATAATITLDGVGKRYADGTVAVSSLSLEIPAGDLVVLVGPSGCGKTTTLRMINRLIEPTCGRILLDGEDVTSSRPGRAAPPDRVRDPAGGSVPAPDDRGQHRHRAASAGLAQARRSSSRRGADGARRPGPQALYATATRTSSPAGSVSGSAWPERSPPIPPVLLMDEPFSAVDPIARIDSKTSSCGCSARCARRSCSSPTTSMRRYGWAIGSRSSPRAVS